MQEWYFLACQYGLTHIEGTIPREIFKLHDGFKLHVGFEELHTIFHLQMLDVTMMMCIKFFEAYPISKYSHKKYCGNN
jgi:hypothetical protein